MREQYYNIFLYNGNPQLDLLSNQFSSFKEYISKKSVKIITVDDSTENMPDLISFNEYGSESYWWLICQINNIVDPFTDLIRGTQLAIPSISDITSFIQTINSISNLNPSNTITV